ncbi:MAG: H-X9-DG-CTERM domain-containing protein [Planctomycetaceae bacterium]
MPFAAEAGPFGHDLDRQIRLGQQLAGPGNLHATPNSLVNCLFEINKNPERCGLAGFTRPWGRVWSSEHVGGAQFVLSDGSARFISQNVDYITLCYLSFIKDAQVFGDF